MQKTQTRTLNDERLDPDTASPILLTACFSTSLMILNLAPIPNHNHRRSRSDHPRRRQGRLVEQEELPDGSREHDWPLQPWWARCCWTDSLLLSASAQNPLDYRHVLTISAVLLGSDVFGRLLEGVVSRVGALSGRDKRRVCSSGLSDGHWHDSRLLGLRLPKRGGRDGGGGSLDARLRQLAAA